MTSKPDVLILGAGIIGVTTAYYLGRAGARVAVVDRREGPGLETSFANGGLFTPSMADPWAAPGMPLKLLKWIGREDAPFLIRPSALPGLAAWGLKFLANCREEAWSRNTAAILVLCNLSQGLLQEVMEAEGLDCDLSRIGTLRLFRDTLSMEIARRAAGAMGALGVAYEELDSAGCAALEPALAAQQDRLQGGIHFPEDRAGDAYKFTCEMAERCRCMGITFHFNETIEFIENDNLSISGVVTSKRRLIADSYVLATGSQAVGLGRRLGLRLPIYPVKGYSLTLPVSGWNGAPKMPLIDDGRKIGLVRLGERLRVVGTAEFTGPDRRLNESRLENLRRNLADVFPDMPNLDQGTPWTGLRPMTPNGLPILGPTRYKNLFLNLGHGHLGWTMALGCASWSPTAS